KLAVSALIFDYLLTGPISGVSAGQYLIGLGLDSLKTTTPSLYNQLGFVDEEFRMLVRNWSAVAIACGITLYFFRQNILGIHESSDKALKIMIGTTVLAVVMLVWCGVTFALREPTQINKVPWQPNLNPKMEYSQVSALDPVTGEKKVMWQKDPRYSADL